jgi:copper transport protein
VVGVVYAIDRVAIFAGLALLIGGIVFMAFVFPPGRRARRGRAIVWAGWAGTVVATIAGISLEGAYAAALPLSKVFDPSVFGDVLDTRYGRVSAVRLVLLVVAFPLLRALFSPRFADGDRAGRLPVWWYAATGLVVAALSFTPGLAGHAGTGDYTGLAIPADAIHVLAMACWLGGLVLLLAVVLPRTDPDELRQGINRYSALALGSIVALVVTGGFQAWRQVGSLTALRDTDYGKLLIAKLVVFAALIVAAAFSREIVNRRFRTFPDDEPDEHTTGTGAELLLPAREPAVPVTVGGSAAGEPQPLAAAFDGGGADGNGQGRHHGDDAERYEEDDDATEVRRLRRSVAAEVVIALVILTITALLVNAAPARSEETSPISMTLESEQVWVDVVIAPGVAGGNDIHLTALPVGDTVVNVEDMTAQLTRPDEDLPPFTVPLRKLGPGHYVSPLYDIPYPGDWQITVRVTLSATDQAVLVGRFTLR